MISGSVCWGASAISWAVITVDDVPTMPGNCPPPLPPAPCEALCDGASEPVPAAGRVPVDGAAAGTTRRETDASS
jgi:hypothetical protein